MEKNGDRILSGIWKERGLKRIWKSNFVELYSFRLILTFSFLLRIINLWNNSLATLCQGEYKKKFISFGGEKLKSGKARSRKRHDENWYSCKEPVLCLYTRIPIESNIFPRHLVTRNRLCSTPPSFLNFSISNWNRKIQDSKIIQSLTLPSKTNAPRKKKWKSPSSPLLSETKRGNTARFHTNVTCHSILAGRLVYRKPSRFVSRLNWGWERGRKIALNNTGLVHFPWRVSCINLPVAGNAYCWMN